MLLTRKCWLIIDRRRKKKHYISINDFNRFIYEHSLDRVRKQFCRYCLHAFITNEILKCHIKDCFKNNSKKTIRIPQKDEYVKFKNFERKIKSSFMILLKVF